MALSRQPLSFRLDAGRCSHFLLPAQISYEKYVSIQLLNMDVGFIYLGTGGSPVEKR